MPHSHESDGATEQMDQGHPPPNGKSAPPSKEAARPSKSARSKPRTRPGRLNGQEGRISSSSAHAPVAGEPAEDLEFPAPEAAEDPPAGSGPPDGLVEGADTTTVAQPAHLDPDSESDKSAALGRHDSVETSALSPVAMIRPPDPNFGQGRRAEPPDDPEPPAWYEKISLGFFADAYLSLNYNLPGAQQGTNTVRAFDNSNGFSFAWAGMDLSHDAVPVGGTVSLRFGPSADTFSGETPALNVVKQGFATWAPRLTGGKLKFDLGKFDTLYGAEVAESQLNMNYTRGVLNWLGQPFFHTGFRARLQPLEKLGVNAIAVNGWNNTLDNNRGKSFGLQLAFTPNDVFSGYLGYITGPEGDRTVSVECLADTSFDPVTGVCIANPGGPGETVDVEAKNVNKRFRHFVDLVVTVDPTEQLSLVLNADVGYDPVVTNPVVGTVKNNLWYGGMASIRYAFLSRFATALRGEFYHDLDDYTTGTGVAENIMIGTATLTLEYAPMPNLIIRLDNRLDAANEKIFAKGTSGSSATQFTTTLGMVVTVF